MIHAPHCFTIVVGIALAVYAWSQGVVVISGTKCTPGQSYGIGRGPRWPSVACMVLWLAIVNTFTACGQDITLVVQQAFRETHQGWSSDEVLVDDRLNAAFNARCLELMPGGTAREFNWTMLNLRKGRSLPGKVTRRKSESHAEYRHAAEIAARRIEDEYRENIDRALCAPEVRIEFDRIAQELAPDVASIRLRKAALGLRKSRQLRPELVARVVDWGRTISSHSSASLREHPELVPNGPGVYLFFDATGYLYIGEASNLRLRLESHLRLSDRPGLARYLTDHGQDADSIHVEIHAFRPDSMARQAAMRRVYESELIASRKPRFNVRP